MRHITQRLRTLGQRFVAAARQRFTHVTSCVHQLDECAALGVARLADVLADLRRR